MNQTAPENSTNVRSHIRARNRAIRSARVALRVMTPVAPRLAAAFAEHLFLTPPRPARPEWEREILSRAERAWVDTEHGPIPTWTWGRATSEETKTVLLVHGWSGRGSQLGAFVEPLERAGLRVVAFDGPGHGDSPARLGSLVTQARAVAALARALGPIEAVVAHSVGGAAALLATRSAGVCARRYALIAPP